MAAPPPAAAADARRALHEQRCARSLALALSRPGARAFPLGAARTLRIAEAHGPAIGSSLWEGALVLLAHLQALPPGALAGARVVELGAGVGLCGLACAALGAAAVALTDCQPAALALAAHNAAANAGALGGGGGGGGCAASVAALAWGGAPWRAFVAGGAGGLGGAPSLLVGSDLVYSEEGARALGELLGAALQPRGSARECLLAYRERGQGGVWWALLAARGLQATALRQAGQHTVYSIAGAGGGEGGGEGGARAPAPAGGGTGAQEEAQGRA